VNDLLSIADWTWVRIPPAPQKNDNFVVIRDIYIKGINNYE